MTDGTITFSTALDNKQLEKELQSTLKKINSLEKSISEMGSGRNALAEQAKEMGAQLDAAKQKLYEMQSAAKGVYSKETIADQKTLVSGLQSEWNKINGRVDSYDQKIKNATARLADEKEHYSDISEQIDKANGKSTKMQDSIERVGMSVEKIGNRIKNLFRRVFLFSVLTSAFRSFRTWLGNVIQSNSEAAASIAQLKGALLTLAQPIVEVIIPAFTALVNIVTKVVMALATLVSWIFGKTISQSKEAAKNLNKETKALGGVGAAANEAKKQLAAFDEINQLVQETSSGGGGGSSTDASFDFDETSFLKNLPNWLKNLAADLQIKIKDLKFDWDRGNILHNKDAWIIALSGILGAVLGGMFGGLHGAVIGLLLGAAIGLIGCTLLDKTSNPEKYKRLAIVALTSILGAVLGAKFGGLTGATLGLLLGLSIGLVSLDFIDGKFEGWNSQDTFLTVMTAILGAVIGSIFGGFAGGVIGLVVGAAISIKALNWIRKLDNPSNDKVLFTTTIITLLSTIIGAIFGGFVGGAIGLVVGLGISIAAVQFDNSIDAATKTKAAAILKTVMLGIIGALIGAAIGGVVGGIVGGVVGITLGLAIHWGDITTDSVPKRGGFYANRGKTSAISKPGSGFGGGGVSAQSSSLRVPALAQGAVIPPNREFMAVLGDQTSGNNIEAPENLIRQIVREETQTSASNELLREILSAIREGKVMMVDSVQFAKVTQRSLSNASRASGAPLTVR
jgi:uncharacterized coiled-coil DUF342 family protein